MTISNWNPDLTTPPGTSKVSLDGYLTTPWAGGLANPAPPPTPTPTPPTGMSLWLNSGTAVAASGTVNWPDSSGNGFNALGSGSLGITTIGGFAYVNGFSATAFLLAAGFNFAETAGYHIYVVAQVNTYNVSGNCLLAADGSTSPGVMAVLLTVGDSGNSNKANHVAGVNASGFSPCTSTSAIPLTQPVIVDAGLNAGAVTQTCKANQQIENAQSYPFGTGAATPFGTYIGRRATATSDFFDGSVAEILVYPPAQDPAAVRTYLASKYSITP